MAIEPTKDKEILSIAISKERKIYVVVAKRFLSNLLKEYCKHPILTSDKETWYPSQAYQFLKIKSLFAFSIWKKHHYIKDYAIHKRQSQKNDLMIMLHAKEKEM